MASILYRIKVTDSNVDVKENIDEKRLKLPDFAFFFYYLMYFRYTSDAAFLCKVTFYLQISLQIDLNC